MMAKRKKDDDDKFKENDDDMNEDYENNEDTPEDFQRFMELLRSMGGIFGTMEVPEEELEAMEEEYADGSDSDYDADEALFGPPLIDDSGDSKDFLTIKRCRYDDYNGSELAGILGMVEHSLKMKFVGTSVANGTLLISSLVDELMEFGDPILFGFKDTVYLGMVNRCGLNRAGADFSYRFYWSFDGGIVSLDTDVIYDFSNNKELLFLAVGDLIEEVLNVGKKKDE